MNDSSLLTIFKFNILCGKFNTSNHVKQPGDNLILHYKNGSDSVKWGNQGIYNARKESLFAYWNSWCKGFIYLDSFYEGGKLFKVDEHSRSLTFAMVIYNYKRSCLHLVTRPSKGTIVEPYHERTLVLLEKPHDLITTGKIVEIDYNRLFLTA